MDDCPACPACNDDAPRTVPFTPGPPGRACFYGPRSRQASPCGTCLHFTCPEPWELPEA